ncbi:MAG: hypothetical protein AW11_02001 [Candidatus Accumulibacter regalis]|uniref:Uncharacterized protein n=1 Tax=Accumulibacter regalis TaxID=522306 RepID=A0A011P1N2_ACCRE|nr:MAG: hypothetical protein AW11_02001 [Candidatus Accumulibacter regalis]
MHQRKQGVRAGHRFFGRDAADLLDGAAEEVEDVRAARALVLIDGHRDVVGHFAQARIALLEQADVLPDAGEDRRSVRRRRLGRRVDLATNPAQRAVGQANPVLALPGLTARRRAADSMLDALHVGVYDLSRGEIGIGEQGAALQSADFVQALAEKGIANPRRTNLALEDHGRDAVGDLTQARLGARYRRLLCLALGDVDDRAKQAGDAAVGLGQGRPVEDRVAPAAIGQLDLRLVDLLADCLQELAILFRVRLREFGREEVVHGSPGPLVARNAEELGERAVEVLIMPAGVGEVDR